MKIEMFGLGLPEVTEVGDSLAKMLADAAAASAGGLRPGDVLVVTSKVISKSSGLLMDLEAVHPSPRALKISRVTGADPRFIQLVLDHSDGVLAVIPVKELDDEGLISLSSLSADPEAAREVIAGTPALLVVTRNGQVYTDAGLDGSNHPCGVVSAPPADPDAAARALRGALKEVCGADLAVIVSDTEMDLRGGTVDVARGASGLQVVDRGFGRKDRFGRPKFGGVDNVALELACAAALVMGQTAEGFPAVLIRGYGYTPSENEGIADFLADDLKLRRILRAVLRSTFKIGGLGRGLKWFLGGR